MMPASTRRGRQIAAAAICAVVTVIAVYRWHALKSAGPPVPEFDVAQASPRVAEAIAAARARVAKDKSSGPAWGRLGTLAMAHHYHAQARACFAEAARLAPGQFRWTYCAGVLDEETDLALAIGQYEKALKLSPDYAPLHYRLARALVRMNRQDDADRQFQRAAELDPDGPTPKTGAGRVDMPDPILQEVQDQELTGRRLAERADEAIARGDLPRAMQLLQELIRLRPDLSRPRLNLGQLLQAQRKLPAAVEVFEQAVERFPDEPLAHFSLGTALEMSGENERARDEYRAALRLKPDYADAHFCLGLVLKKQNDLAGAAEALGHAVSANPGFVPGRVALASALEGLGDREGALAQLRLAVQLAPNDPEARAQLERLGKANERQE
jgi:tetratricopeptide (TPR) repeat protein